MIRSSLLALAGFFALTGTILPARAWDPIGHMLVGQIAYDRLTPDAKVQMDAAIARFNKEKITDRRELDAPYDAVIAPCWMDDVRSLPKVYNFGPWHYVNLPFTPDGMPAPDDSAGPNVIWGIRHCEAILAGTVTDPAINKDQALVMLLHLTGDIHQPLHTTSRNDDAGGNKVKIANLKDPLADLIFTKGGNLHFFWDSAYRRVYRDGKATVLYEAPLHERMQPVAGHRAVLDIVRREATALQKKYPPAMFKEQGDALGWAKESHAIGYSLGYGTLPTASGPITLPESYVTAARNTAEERIVLAGYRLGNWLNTYFASPPAPTAASTPAPTPTPSASPSPTLAPTTIPALEIPQP